jgi:hypothetical protein
MTVKWRPRASGPRIYRRPDQEERKHLAAQLAGWASAPFVIEERQQRQEQQRQEEAEKARIAEAEKVKAEKEQAAAIQPQAQKSAWDMHRSNQLIRAIDVILHRHD